MSTVTNEDHLEPPRVHGTMRLGSATVEVTLRETVSGWQCSGYVQREGCGLLWKAFRGPTSREAWAAFTVWAAEVLS